MLGITNNNDICQIELQRPPVNALNPQLIDELRAALETQIENGARGIILTGREGLFSAGLDIPELLQLDCEGISRFWQGFFGLLECLARSPIPVVAAISGHSPAGGTVLTLFCDYRVMAAGDYKLGLNEVQVGLVVPPVIQRSLVRLIGPHAAERHMVTGDMIDAARALELGMVDELAPPAQCADRARQWLEYHLRLPAHAMSETRRLARADLAGLFDDPTELGIERFVNLWFREDTQTALRALVAKLGKK
ncbi:MAG: enoyl-CoA hydratase/isomerase family protein [Wenzhouxiangellaceae bacterium]